MFKNIPSFFLLTKYSALAESILSCLGSQVAKVTSFTPFHMQSRLLPFHVNVMLNLSLKDVRANIFPHLNLFHFSPEVRS